MSTRIDRDDAVAAADFVDYLLPDPAARAALLSFMAQSILAAHEAGPSTWNLTINGKQYLALVVSHCFMLAARRDRLEVYVDIDSVTEDLARDLGERLQSTASFATLPKGHQVLLQYNEIEELLPKLERAQLALVALAGPMYSRSHNAKQHHSGLLEVISQETGIELPDPSFVDRVDTSSNSSRDSRFGEIGPLYEEFVRGFAMAAAGQAHAQMYVQGRDSAEANFHELCRAADAGEDIGDRVLLHLLPHAKTKGNLAKGAWIHVAPAITKDARALFEGAGWAKPEDWPTITAALLAFVRRCVDSPDQLGDAVGAFSQKGLQAGMVTPILNALRPDAFLISNKKSCALVSYLSGAKHTTSLSGYPALNAAGFAEIERLRPMFAAHDRPGRMTDSDLFDMFGHWLVAVRKFAFGKKSAVAAAAAHGVTSSWLFQCNPKIYDLRAALRELPAITWVVRQHKSDIAEGHTAFLWQSGPNAGILARGRVAAPPLTGVDQTADEEFMLEPDQFKSTELFVPVEIEHVYRPPVSRAALKRNPKLAGLGILKFTQGTNFPVTDAEAEALLELEGPEDARFWSVSTPAKRWTEFRDGGFVAVAWPEIGDISGMTREEFDRALDRAAVANPGDYGHTGAAQMWTFAAIEPGDRVVASTGPDIALGIGTVIGPYAYVDSSPHAHRLAVRWDDVQARRHASDPKWQRLVAELTPEEFDEAAGAPPIAPVPDLDDAVEPGVPVPELVEVIEDAEPAVPIEPNEVFGLEDVEKATAFDRDLLERWVRAIHRKGQAVLYGPPGTGKTFVADWLARHLAGGGYGTIETVQFHPAYSYEEFMAGIRPRTRPDGSLEYALEDGFFVRFCDRARKLRGTSVLIIDELNRANLPRVFGELMYLLEYRDKKVAIAGSRQFSIPDNVRIIGTMNTADRSIALVDHALRRRFAFLGLLPNYDVLRNRQGESGIDVEGLIGVLTKLNSAIDDPHYEVGISFFCGPDLAASIADIWQMEIEPYIEEYFFDRRSLFAEYRWPKVKAAILGPGAGEL